MREGTGGMQALGDDDKANIEQTIDDDVLKQKAISFRSTAVEAAADGGGLSVQGELTLFGATRPLAFDLAVRTTARSAPSRSSSRPTGGSSPTPACSER